MPKNTISPAVAAVQELGARLEAARQDHAAAVTRHRELSAQAQRISDALTSGTSEGVTEDRMIDNRQRLEAATALAEAKRRAVAGLDAQLAQAEAELIAESVRTEAGGYVSWDQLRAETEAAVAEAIARLDAIAKRAEERNAFLSQAAEQLRRVDGGSRTEGAEVGGVRRVLWGGEQTIEIDGERVLTMPAGAVYETATDAIETAAVPSVMWARLHGEDPA